MRIPCPARLRRRHRQAGGAAARWPGAERVEACDLRHVDEDMRAAAAQSSASETIRSSAGQSGRVQLLAAHNASPSPWAIRSSVGHAHLAHFLLAGRCNCRSPAACRIGLPTTSTSHNWLHRSKSRFRKLPDFKMTSSPSRKHCRHASLTLGRSRVPSTISRGAKTEAVAGVVATVSHADLYRARGMRALPPLRRDPPEATLAVLEAMQEAVSGGLDRRPCSAAMPAGAARNALDCALLDLEAKSSGQRA